MARLTAKERDIVRKGGCPNLGMLKSGGEGYEYRPDQCVINRYGIQALDFQNYLPMPDLLLQDGRELEHSSAPPVYEFLIPVAIVSVAFVSPWGLFFVLLWVFSGFRNNEGIPFNK